MAMAKKFSSSVRTLFLVLPTVLSQVIAWPGVLGVGGGLMISSSAQAADLDFSQYQCDPLVDEQCACEAALKENTIQALEEFLRKYPPGRKPSACGALALNALSKFACNDGGGTNNCGNGGNGYGT
jgi:hypothetical protein